MARRPPQHAVDATPIFIPEDDDAWDHARIDEEKRAMVEAGEDPDEHPFERYLGGETRYDLDAPMRHRGETVSIREYIDDQKKPERWILKRLKPRDYLTLASLHAQNVGAASFDACVVGIKDLENGPKLKGLKMGRLTDRDMAYVFNSGIVIQLGTAVIRASMPLRADEGEASGS